MIPRLWAPAAAAVEIVLGAERLPLRPAGGGWWHVPERTLGSGEDYAFVVDGGSPLADPRSPWQPAGVPGPSRAVDLADFAWSDSAFRPEPLANAIIYELHVGTFTPAGTFEGAIDRLPHLVDLGVTHVEIMPVAEFPGRRGWGYDGVALWAPHQAYGGPRGFQRLVDACHQAGLAVVLDVVYNHVGPSGSSLARCGPYFTDRYRTPWGDAVNFDGPDSDEVRRFVIENALMWLRDYHVDALRLDAVHAIFDQSALPILEELALEVKRLGRALGRPLLLIAESDLNDPRLTRPPGAGGLGLDAQWSDDFHHALHAVLTGEREGIYADFGRLADVAAVLTRGFVYTGQYSAFRRRRHGRAPAGLGGERFVVHLQNHDQIGNRAAGERISHLVGLPCAKVGAAILLTAPFVPLIFQGEEWAASSPFLYFTDHADPGLAEAVARGRRREFAAWGWDPAAVPDPQAPETFDRSCLRWEERERAEHAEMLAWFRALIRLRRRHPELAAGSLAAVTATFDEDRRWLLLRRRGWTVGCNLGPRACRLQLEDLSEELVLASDAGVTLSGRQLGLPPRSVGIVRARVPRGEW